MQRIIYNNFTYCLVTNYDIELVFSTTKYVYKIWRFWVALAAKFHLQNVHDTNIWSSLTIRFTNVDILEYILWYLFYLASVIIIFNVSWM